MIKLIKVLKQEIQVLKQRMELIKAEPDKMEYYINLNK